MRLLEVLFVAVTLYIIYILLTQSNLLYLWPSGVMCIQTAWWLMIDDWCMMTDDWCLMTDDWCMMTDDWWLMHDDWWLMHDDWWLMHDDWCMMTDAWWLMHDDWWLMIDDWWLMPNDCVHNPETPCIYNFEVHALISINVCELSMILLHKQVFFQNLISQSLWIKFQP